jgi:hypothetical protein
VIRDLNVRYDNGLEGIFRTFEFVEAEERHWGVFQITIRPRFCLFFRGRPRVFTGAGAHWRDLLDRAPSLGEGVFLCQCWILLMKKDRPQKKQRFIINPLRM